MSDIECLTTYGFRGEALSSLCQVSQLSLVSRTSSDQAASRTLFSPRCEVVTMNTVDLLNIFEQC